jgi:hypothetical protein
MVRQKRWVWSGTRLVPAVDAANTALRISLQRDTDQSAPNSDVTLPAPFSITAPACHEARRVRAGALHERNRQGRVMTIALVACELSGHAVAIPAIAQQRGDVRHFRAILDINRSTHASAFAGHHPS